MAKKKSKSTAAVRRTFTNEFKREAVQMLIDGHSASSVSKNLGLNNTNLLYRWKAEQIDQLGPVASALDDELKQLRDELLRTKRERDILKKVAPGKVVKGAVRNLTNLERLKPENPSSALRSFRVSQRIDQVGAHSSMVSFTISRPDQNDQTISIPIGWHAVLPD